MHRSWIHCWLLIAAQAACACAESFNSRERELLVDGDLHYSDEQQLVGRSFNSPGYHTTVPDGQWVHPTRQSLEYAALLVRRNRPGDAERAEGIICRVIGLQDRHPEHATFGIWPWLLEEPLEQMNPPDWNWADFLGAQLAEMLVLHRDRLSPELQEAIRGSLADACAAIRRRDVQPSYTNIAIMGGVVCAAAGEVLGDDDLLQYGRQRLEKVVAHGKRHGGFNEYNSPTYTLVALWEADRGLRLLRDLRARAAAESLRRSAWITIADSYHPGTRQWGGPHSRAYSDSISADLARELEQTAPADLADRFRALPADPLQIRRSFVRGETEYDSVEGVTWHTRDACLGSASRATLWTQRRPLIGYWRAGDGPAAVLRLRFLCDGRDFASMGVATRQEGAAALTVLYSLPNQGCWHPTLDRPADGVFRAADLRVRYELTAADARVESLRGGAFTLAAGQRRVRVYPAPGRFDGREVAWCTGREGQTVFVDGICYEGTEAKFDFRSGIPMLLAIGVELTTADGRDDRGIPTVCAEEDGRVVAEWALGNTTLTVGTR